MKGRHVGTRKRIIMLQRESGKRRKKHEKDIGEKLGKNENKEEKRSHVKINSQVFCLAGNIAEYWKLGMNFILLVKSR